MKKRLLGLLLIVLILIAAMPTAVTAAGLIDTEKMCNLTVTFTPEGTAASDVTFRIYRVADLSQICEFTPSEQYRALAGQRLEKPTAEDYRILTSTLLGEIAAKKIAPTAQATTNDKGIAVFRELPVGLYLVTGDVCHLGRYFYTPEAFMVALPNRSDKNLWEYDVSSGVKYTARLDSETVELRALKVWSDSAENAHAADSVTVELYDGDTLFDTQTLSKKNDWSYTWTELYGGTVWRIREKDCPKGYTASVEQQARQFVITNTKATPQEPSKPNLPQTGLLWWPVPIMALCGLVLLGLGLWRRRTERSK